MKQLNQKTPWVFRLGVALLCVMLMTTHFTGNLYARYSTTATGSDSARVAKFDCEVNYRSSGYGGDEMAIDDKESDWKGVYVVIDEFEVLNSGEVALSYTLKLRLANYSQDVNFNSKTGDTNTIAAPANINSVFHIKHVNLDSTDGQISQEQVDEVLLTRHHSDDEVINTNDISSFVAGKAYYGLSDDGLKYTWYDDATVENVDNFETVSYGLKELGVGKAHYYKIVYFIDMTNESSPYIMENLALSLVYSMDCSQID